MNIPGNATEEDVKIFNSLTREEINYIALYKIAEARRILRNGTIERLCKEAKSRTSAYSNV